LIEKIGLSVFATNLDADVKDTASDMRRALDRERKLLTRNSKVGQSELPRPPP
jgi:hypothetical protein